MRSRSQAILSGNMGIFLLLLVAMLLVVHPAEGANLKATPQLTLGAGWDSNIFSATTDEQSDFVFRGTPQLTLSLSTPTVTMDLIGAIVGEKYADHTELDKADAAKSVDFRLVRTGPRLTVAPSGRYVETNDISRQLLAVPGAPLPGPGIPPPESLLSERIRSKELTGVLQMTYLLSSRWTLEFGGSAGKREFAGNSAGLTDSRTVGGNGSVEYQFSPRTKGGIYLNTASYFYDNRPDSRTYSGGLRGSLRASEHTTLSASGGATLLREETGTGGKVNEDWSPAGSLSLEYTSHDFRAFLFGSYEVAGGGSFGTDTNRGTVSLALSDRIGRSWTWDLYGAWQSNKSTGNQAGPKQDIDTVSGTAGLKYEALTWLSFRLSGSIYRQNSKTSVGQDIDRDTVQLDMILANSYNIF